MKTKKEMRVIEKYLPLIHSVEWELINKKLDALSIRVKAIEEALWAKRSDGKHRKERYCFRR